MAREYEFKYEIQWDCKRCGKCLICPLDAISIGAYLDPFIIDQDKCVRCGQCTKVCTLGKIFKVYNDGRVEDPNGGIPAILAEMRGERKF